MISLIRSLPTCALLIAAAAIAPAISPTTAHALPGGEVPLDHGAVDQPAAADQADEAAAMACPVLGDSTFTDSWGAPRSGGRRHEGVDMIAASGTPVVAVQRGVAEFTRNRLGGNAVWITTSEGDRFYYAHLDHFAESAHQGSRRPVARGEVIGFVGSTGNAKGPHLHFETHFGGTVGNPYPATYEACTQPVIDALDALDALRRGAEFSPAPGDVDAVMTAVRVEDDDFFSEEFIDAELAGADHTGQELTAVERAGVELTGEQLELPVDRGGVAPATLQTLR